MIRVFSHWFPVKTLLNVAFDLALLCLFLVIIVVWRDYGLLHVVAGTLPYSMLFVLGMMATIAFLGIYPRDSNRSAFRPSIGVILCFLFAAPMAYGVSSLVLRPAIWREEMELAVLLAFSILLARSYVVRNGFRPFLHRVIVLGTGAEAALVEQSLTRSSHDVRIMGFYPVRSDEAIQVASDRILEGGCSLVEATRRLKVDEIIVAVRERRSDAMPVGELLVCKLSGVRVLDLSSYFERTLGQVRVDFLRASWLIFGDGFRQNLPRKAVKRLFDIVAATVLLLACLPLMLLSAILIVLESGYPIFYRQDRVGQGGRIFNLIKFRSMRIDAEQDGKPRWAAQTDVRVTRIGRVLRRLRIDELPQIYNVLRGDMSLVGPRPERPYFVDRLTREIPFYATRHSVKPGITGWAQVRYHYGESVADTVQKLQYDLYYVKNHTLFLDSLILLETVGVVLTGEGAR